MKKRTRASTVLRLAAVLIFFTAAPTAGDIGSCGQAPDDLDPARYFALEKTIDCKKCIECELLTDQCKLACKPALGDPWAFFATSASAECQTCIQDEMPSSTCKAACTPCKLGDSSCESASECCSFAPRLLMPFVSRGPKACDEGFCLQVEFLRDCYPVVHDGEVCADALQASSCSDYRSYMSDTEPTIPTECNSCPPCDDGGLPDGSPVLPRCE
jgi:hypothetical protein